MKHTPFAAVLLAVSAGALSLNACAFRVDSGDTLADRSLAPHGGRDAPTGSSHASTPGASTSTTTGQSGQAGQTGNNSVAPLPAWDPSRTFTGLRTGHIQGAVGYANVDAPTDLSSVYDDGSYAQVEVYALRSDGIRVMLQLQVANGSDGPFLQPGLAIRMEPGASYQGATILGVGCAGPDSGASDVNDAFQYTDYDQQPCDVGVGTQQDPNDPQALDVTLQATFADDNGNCDPMPGDNGDGTAPLPDPNGGCDGGNDGSTDPNGGATDPNGGSTDPNGGSTDPNGGSTDPNGGSTGTDPNGGSSSSTHPLARASFVLTR